MKLEDHLTSLRAVRDQGLTDDDVKRSFVLFPKLERFVYNAEQPSHRNSAINRAFLAKYVGEFTLMLEPYYFANIVNNHVLTEEETITWFLLIQELTTLCAPTKQQKALYTPPQHTKREEMDWTPSLKGAYRQRPKGKLPTRARVQRVHQLRAFWELARSRRANGSADNRAFLDTYAWGDAALLEPARFAAIVNQPYTKDGEPYALTLGEIRTWHRLLYTITSRASKGGPDLTLARYPSLLTPLAP